MITAREVLVDDPLAKSKVLTKQSRNLVVMEDNGQLHVLDDGDGANLWSDVVQGLPPECMKFALNAAQDTLPHNANLSVRKEKLASLINVSCATIDKLCYMC